MTSIRRNIGRPSSISSGTVSAAGFRFSWLWDPDTNTCSAPAGVIGCCKWEADERCHAHFGVRVRLDGDPPQINAPFYPFHLSKACFKSLPARAGSYTARQCTTSSLLSLRNTVPNPIIPVPNTRHSREKRPLYNRHSREIGNLEARAHPGSEFVKHPPVILPLLIVRLMWTDRGYSTTPTFSDLCYRSLSGLPPFANCPIRSRMPNRAI